MPTKGNKGGERFEGISKEDAQILRAPSPAEQPREPYVLPSLTAPEPPLYFEDLQVDMEYVAPPVKVTKETRGCATR
jgi:hypothetical protein